MAEYKKPKLKKLKKIKTDYPVAKDMSKDVKMAEGAQKKMKLIPMKVSKKPIEPSKKYDYDMKGMTGSAMKEGMEKARMKREKKIQRLIKKIKY